MWKKYLSNVFIAETLFGIKKPIKKRVRTNNSMITIHIYHRLYNTVVSHFHIALRWPIMIHVRKVSPFYFRDPVLQFSQIGY